MGISERKSPRLVRPFPFGIVKFLVSCHPTALKLAQARLPLQTEFITLSSPPRLGRIATPALADPPAAQPIPNNLAYLDAKEEGGARRVIMRREERAVEEIVDGLRGLEMKDAAKGIDG